MSEGVPTELPDKGRGRPWSQLWSHPPPSSTVSRHRPREMLSVTDWSTRSTDFDPTTAKRAHWSAAKVGVSAPTPERTGRCAPATHRSAVHGWQ